MNWRVVQNMSGQSLFLPRLILIFNLNNFYSIKMAVLISITFLKEDSNISCIAITF